MSSLEPQRIERDRTTLVGIMTRTDNAREMDPMTARIGPLWERFFAEAIGEAIPQVSDEGAILAAYTDFESDADGPYTLVVGKSVDGSPDVNAPLRSVEIPAGTYLRFRAAGEMPAALVDAWRAIWEYFQSAPESRRYEADVETHRSLENGQSVVDIDIGIHD